MTPSGTPPPEPAKKPEGRSIFLVLPGRLGLRVIVALIAAVAGTGYTARSRSKGTAIPIPDKILPGEKELQARGCFFATITDAEEPPPREEVRCYVSAGKKAPSCDDVASTYVGAVGTRSRPFAVGVQQIGGTKGLCVGRYDVDGGRAVSASESNEP